MYQEYILIVIIFLVGCVNTPVSGVFNRDYEQDKACYEKLGGRYGYCDVGGR